MSAVMVIRALLVGAAAVTARVPADRIGAGTLKEDAPLPALVLAEVSSVPVGAFDAQAEYSVVTSRVQVTAVGTPYREIKALVDLARRACNFKSGTIAGVNVVSVLRDAKGPDLEDQAGNSVQSIDFLVTYHEPN